MFEQVYEQTYKQEQKLSFGKAGRGGSNAGLAAEPPALPAPHPPSPPHLQAEAVPPWGPQSQLVPLKIDFFRVGPLSLGTIDILGQINLCGACFFFYLTSL